MIQIGNPGSIFHLETKKTSYVLGVYKSLWLSHYNWSGQIEPDARATEFVPAAPAPCKVTEDTIHKSFSLYRVPLEYPYGFCGRFSNTGASGILQRPRRDGSFRQFMGGCTRADRISTDYPAPASTRRMMLIRWRSRSSTLCMDLGKMSFMPQCWTSGQCRCDRLHRHPVPHEPFPPPRVMGSKFQLSQSPDREGRAADDTPSGCDERQPRMRAGSGPTLGGPEGEGPRGERMVQGAPVSHPVRELLQTCLALRFQRWRVDFHFGGRAAGTGVLVSRSREVQPRSGISLRWTQRVICLYCGNGREAVQGVVQIRTDEAGIASFPFLSGWGFPLV